MAFQIDPFFIPVTVDLEILNCIDKSLIESLDLYMSNTSILESLALPLGLKIPKIPSSPPNV